MLASRIRSLKFQQIDRLFRFVKTLLIDGQCGRVMNSTDMSEKKLSSSAENTHNFKPDTVSATSSTRSGHLDKRMRKHRKRKPKPAGQVTNHPRKRCKYLQDKSYTHLSQYIENGMRKIKPYHFRFETHAKGRWIGKSLIEVFKKEFRIETSEYYKTAINGGLITLNGKRVTADTIIRSQNFLQSRVHRHEPPVTGVPLDIIAQTDDFIVINKPASIPIHPAGKYRHNSIVYLMAKEHGIQGLHTFYRLDRLTSGVFIFARSTEVVKKIDGQMRDRQLHKIYLCKVHGEFPSKPVECAEPILSVSFKIGVCRVSPDGKSAKTMFQRVSYDGETSIIKCTPHTGRMHQIRVHLQYLGHPVMNDPLYTGPVWGPDQGKDGNIPFANNDEFVAELIRLHNAEQLKQHSSPNDSKSPEVSDTQKLDTPSDEAPMSHQESSSSVICTVGNDATVYDLDRNQKEHQSGQVFDNAVSSCSKSSTEGKDPGMDSQSVSEANHKQDSIVDLPCSNTTTEGQDPDMNRPSASSGTSHRKDGVGGSIDTSGEDSVKDNKTLVRQRIVVSSSRDNKANNKETNSKDVTVDRDYSSQWEGVNQEEDQALDKLAIELCRDCQNPLPDPKPEEMMLYLHALTYKGPDFEFSASLPKWAEEHMDRTGSKMPCNENTQP